MKKRYLVEIEHNDYFVCSECRQTLAQLYKQDLIEQFRVKVVKNCSNETCYSCQAKA